MRLNRLCKKLCIHRKQGPGAEEDGVNEMVVVMMQVEVVVNEVEDVMMQVEFAV
jgi:hypothetical protein